MSNYVIMNGQLCCTDELMHYGVKGMKWGHRKVYRYENKARTARDSAKEWKEIGAYKSAKYMQKGRIDKANKVKAKYNSYANKDFADARRYEERAKVEKKKANFRDARAKVSKSRSMGAKLATNIMAGPFANRTYNSVKAATGNRTAAIAATFVTGCLGGPVGHLAVSALYTNAAGSDNLRKKY